MNSVVYLTLTLFIYVVSKEERPMLTCNETLKSTLTILPMECSIDNGYTSITCEGLLDNPIHSNKKRKSEIQFWKVNPINNESRVVSCIGILWFSGTMKENDNTDTNYGFYFNNALSVGKMVLPPECWTNRRTQCVPKVFVRRDVWALPPFAHSPDMPEFWNFSSPLLRAELRFLEEMSLEGFVNKTYSSVFPGLAGCSLERMSIQGYFGTDERGHIPAFDHLPNLDYLSISNNRRMEFASELFNGSHGITSFRSDRNELSGISNIISMLKNLTNLSITSNKRELYLNPKLFVDLNNLEYLNFSNTRLQNWPIQFPPLLKLKTLSLSRCGLQSFSSTFLNFTALYNLELSGNFLTSLSETAFTTLPSLSRLMLNDNKISFISKQTLRSLYRLQYLNLSNNLITTWPTFSQHSIFLTLNLSNNNLTSIVNLGKLGVYALHLDISHNSIMYWNDSNIFLYQRPYGHKYIKNNTTAMNVYNTKNLVPWVLYLNISRNPITTFSEDMLFSLNELKTVDLGGINIDCNNCKLKLLQRWLSYTTIDIQVLGSKHPLSCTVPENLKGKPVQNLDFDKICTISRQRFWWVLGSILLVVASSIFILSGVTYYYRTEVVYLLHLAKVRATSRRKHDDQTDCIYDAFVCYSGGNRKWVLRRLAVLLERRPERFRLCFFDRDFRLGSHIVTNIVDAIDRSRKVVVVLTEKFVQSKWCQWELEMANHKMFGEDREFLVLLQLEPLARDRLPRLLRFLLDTRPVVRWPRPETPAAVLAAAQQLRRALGPSLWQQAKGAPASPSSSHAPLLPTHQEELAE